MQFSIYSLLSLGMAAVAIADIRFANRTGTQVFTPGGNVIPAGQPYQITWNRATRGTISLVLLNHVDQPKSTGEEEDKGWRSIVMNHANTGIYYWTPSLEIAPHNTGYVIRIQDDDTGNFQSSAPFGISNPSYVKPASTTATPTSNVTSLLLIINGTSTATSVMYANTTAPYPMTASGGAINSTVIRPTGSSGVPSSLLTATQGANGGSSTGGSQPAQTSAPPGNAAGKLGASCAGALLGVAAVAAFIL